VCSGKGLGGGAFLIPYTATQKDRAQFTMQGLEEPLIHQEKLSLDAWPESSRQWRPGYYFVVGRRQGRSRQKRATDRPRAVGGRAQQRQDRGDHASWQCEANWPRAVCAQFLRQLFGITYLKPVRSAQTITFVPRTYYVRFGGA